MNSPSRSTETRGNTRSIALLSIFVAVILVLTFTPIGFLNLVVIKATIIHIPVIIGSVLFGPKKGAVLGLFFGAGSLFVNTMTPSLLSFAFSPFIPVPGMEHGSPWALVICFVPRILVGVVPYYVYRLFQGLFRKTNGALRPLSLLLAGILGSFTNTILVMGMIFVVFRNAYAVAKEIPVDAVLGVVLGIIGTNGVPEAIVSAVVVPAICLPLLKLLGSPDALTGATRQKGAE
ncbi:MAG: ECF transporter S component [Oscillospiraceae bacterium]